MQISHVKPDLESILHFFDHQHLFFTKLNVYFQHNNQNFRAELTFPYHKKGHLLINKIEVFYDQKWSLKKGDPYQYGIALTNHQTVILLGKMINGLEQEAKNQLEKRFRAIVIKLAAKLKEEIDPFYPIECEVSLDYMNIIIEFELNGDMIEGKVETNNYFPHTVVDDEFLIDLLENYKTQTLCNLEKMQIVQSGRKEGQKTYITTIPLVNPIVGEYDQDQVVNVSIHCEGLCSNCHFPVDNGIKSSVKINLLKLEQHKLDILISVIDDKFVCENCQNVVKKEKIVIKDVITGKPLAERSMDDLFFLGYMKDQEYLKQMILSAITHDEFFREHENSFWNAYSYIASRRWDLFVAELTRKELYDVLRDYVSDIAVNASKDKLLSMVKRLGLTEEGKQTFWKKANQPVIEYYLSITIFGWNMEKEVSILGPNRAAFIFQYFPIPADLDPFYQIHEAFFAENEVQSIPKLLITIEQQKQQLRLVQQENGRLSEKLGQSYDRISELEQASSTLSTEMRYKNDIIKIQQLKGLIEELKAEIPHASKSLDQQETIEEIVLSEEPIEQENFSVAEILRGKNILLLGGYRSKQVKEQREFTLLTHDARNLDPHFFELLKKSDIIIILTRYISHHAMWEAKEYAILENKPMYYTTFTNIPAIIAEVARKLSF